MARRLDSALEVRSSGTLKPARRKSANQRSVAAVGVDELRIKRRIAMGSMGMVMRMDCES